MFYHLPVSIGKLWFLVTDFFSIFGKYCDNLYMVLFHVLERPYEYGCGIVSLFFNFSLNENVKFRIGYLFFSIWLIFSYEHAYHPDYLFSQRVRRPGLCCYFLHIQTVNRVKTAEQGSKQFARRNLVCRKLINGFYWIRFSMC